MAKKQTRRSISVSRVTYERLKSFCEANNISMSQFVETRVGESLGDAGTTMIVPTQPRPTLPATPRAHVPAPKSETRPSAPVIPMTSAAARSKSAKPRLARSARAISAGRARAGLWPRAWRAHSRTP